MLHMGKQLISHKQAACVKALIPIWGACSGKSPPLIVIMNLKTTKTPNKKQDSKVDR